MRFTVWHAKHPTFDEYTREDSRLNPNRQRQKFPVDYTKIAEVEAHNLEHLFFIGATADKPWLYAPEVRASFVPDASVIRPVAVGDVAVDAEGNVFYCELIGWRKLRIGNI